MSKSTHAPLSRHDFSQLVEQHHRELIAYAHALAGDRHSAQDIVQEACVTAYRLADTFDASRSFPCWVRGIIRFKHREWHRKQKRVPEPLPDAEIGLIDQILETRDDGPPIFIALEECLSRLPETLGSAVAAFYLENQSGDSASNTLGISAASLRKRLERARTQLLTCIEGKNASEQPELATSHTA